MDEVERLRVAVRDGIAARTKGTAGSLRRTLFKMFDTDGDGYINLDEFRVGVEKAYSGLREGQVRALFQYLDVDGSGSVTKEELTARLLGEALAAAGVGPKARTQHVKVAKGVLRGAFGRAKRGQATIAANNVAAKLSYAQIKKLQAMLLAGVRSRTKGTSGSERRTILRAFASIDQSGDGKITVEEFLVVSESYLQGVPKSHVRALFEFYDQDSSGALTKAEIVNAICGDSSAGGGSSILGGASGRAAQRARLEVEEKKGGDDLDGDAMATSLNRLKETQEENQFDGQWEDESEGFRDIDQGEEEQDAGLADRVVSVLAEDATAIVMEEKAEKRRQARERRNKEFRQRAKEKELHSFRALLRGETEKIALEPRMLASLIRSTDRLQYKQSSLYRVLGKRVLAREFMAFDEGAPVTKSYPSLRPKKMRPGKNSTKRATADKSVQEREAEVARQRARWKAARAAKGRKSKRSGTINFRDFLHVIRKFNPPGYDSFEDGGACGLSIEQIKSEYDRCDGSYINFLEEVFPKPVISNKPKMNKFGFVSSSEAPYIPDMQVVVEIPKLAIPFTHTHHLSTDNANILREERVRNAISGKKIAGEPKASDGVVASVFEGPFDRAGKGERFVRPPRIVPDRIQYRFSKTPVSAPSDWDQREITRSATLPDKDLQLEHVYGYKGSAAGSPTAGSDIFKAATGEIVYYIAAVVILLTDRDESSVPKQRHFRRHTNDITCLTVNSAGTIAASGQMDKLPFLYVWDVRTLLPLARIGMGEYERYVCCAAFSADGKRLAAVGADNQHTMMVWDWKRDNYPRLACIKKLKKYRVACDVPDDMFKMPPNPKEARRKEQEQEFALIGEDDEEEESDLKAESLSRGYMMAEIPCQKGDPPCVASVAWAPVRISASTAGGGRSGNRRKGGAGSMGGSKELIVSVGVNHLKFYYIGGQDEVDENTGFRRVTVRLGRFESFPQARALLSLSFMRYPMANTGTQKLLAFAGADNGNVYIFNAQGSCLSCINAHSGPVRGLRCLAVTDPSFGAAKAVGAAASFISGGGDGMVIQWAAAADGNFVSKFQAIGKANIKALQSKAPTPSVAIESSKLGFSTSKPKRSLFKKEITASSAADPSKQPSYAVSAICLSDAQDGAKLDNSNLSTYVFAGTAGHAMWRLKLAPSDRNKKAGAVAGGSARRRRPGSATRSTALLTQGRGTTAHEAISESRKLIAGHHGCLRGLAMMDFGLGLSDLFVTAGEDCILRVWNASTRRPTSYNNIGDGSRKRGGKSKYKLPGQATCIDLCPDDSRAGEVAIGFSKGGMAVMDLQRNTALASFQVVPSMESIEDIKYSPDGSSIAVGARDNIIYVFDVGAGVGKSKGSSSYLNLRGRCLGHTSYITHVDWSADSRLLQSNCGSYEIIYWDARRCKALRSTRDRIEADAKWDKFTCVLGFPVMGIWPDDSDGTDVNALQVSPCGDYVVTADDFGTVKVFNAPCVVEDAPARTGTGHSSHVSNVRFLSRHESQPDYRVVSVGGLDCAVFQWRLVDAKAQGKEAKGGRHGYAERDPMDWSRPLPRPPKSKPWKPQLAWKGN